MFASWVAGWKGSGDISDLLARQLTLGGPSGAGAAAARPLGAAALEPAVARPVPRRSGHADDVAAADG